MTHKRAPYKTYTREFKLEALRLMNESDLTSGWHIVFISNREFIQ